MNHKRRIHFLPKTKIGKVSFWIVIASFIGLYMQYWIAMAFRLSILPFIGLLPMVMLVVCGITSFIAILKYRDYAISLFLSALLGLFGVLFVIGEFVFPH